MNYKKLFLIFAILFALISIVAISNNYKKSKKIKSLTSRLDNIESELDKKKDRIEELEGINEDLEEKLSNVQHFDNDVVINGNYSSDGTNYTGSVIETQIDGDFEGWEGETIFKMMDGSIWQQSSYDYTYHYAYSPNVIIYSKGGQTFMKVEDVDDEIAVKRIR
ncbi:MAG TPA: hypothetical protein PKW69_11795 [Niabella sp.]|nr:hypothetical protein [Niabella sp.]